MSTEPIPEQTSIRNGLLAAAGAYVLWGFLPVFFKTLGDVPPLMILAHRIVWSVPTAVVLVAVAGKLGEIAAVLRRPSATLALAASGLAIAANWTIYIWAVTQGRVLEGSLGYFINPLISFLFAALLFGERFSKLQLAALAIAALGVVNQTVIVGQFPWVALSLAVSFAVYGVIRKRVAVDARVGFALEAIFLAPFAIAYLLFLLPPGIEVFADGSLKHILLFIAAGPVTAAPLILFAFGARRLRLSTVAVLQYIGPSLQFLIGLAYGEAFTPAHAVTFGLIWGGAALFTFAAWLKDPSRRPVAATG